MTLRWDTSLTTQMLMKTQMTVDLQPYWGSGRSRGPGLSTNTKRRNPPHRNILVPRYHGYQVARNSWTATAARMIFLLAEIRRKNPPNRSHDDQKHLTNQRMRDCWSGRENRRKRDRYELCPLFTSAVRLNNLPCMISYLFTQSKR